MIWDVSLIIFLGIFFTAVMRIIFTYSHAVLLMIFILVPLIDIVKSLQGQSRPKYDFLLYFGILLPNLLIIVRVFVEIESDISQGVFIIIWSEFCKIISSTWTL